MARASTAPPCMELKGTRCVMFKRNAAAKSVALDTASAAVLKAQLDARRRVIAYLAHERALAAGSSRNLPSSTDAWRRPIGKAKAARPFVPGSHGTSVGGGSSPSGLLTAAQIRALQSRELTPEDYELLLRLDESVQRKNLLSAEAASNLIQTILAEDAECSVCLCDMQKGECTVVLGCSHCFHPECIKEWLTRGRDTCPICTAKVQ